MTLSPRSHLSLQRGRHILRSTLLDSRNDGQLQPTQPLRLLLRVLEHEEDALHAGGDLHHTARETLLSA